MNDIPYVDAISFLTSRVPEFEANVAEMRDFFGQDVGNHVLGGEFARYLSELLAAHERGEVPAEPLRAAFAAVEELANSTDPGTEELAQMGVLETLGNDRELARAVLPWLGPHSRELFDELERFWGESD